jgi:hypothetical protein
MHAQLVAFTDEWTTFGDLVCGIYMSAVSAQSTSFYTSPNSHEFQELYPSLAHKHPPEVSGGKCLWSFTVYNVTLWFNVQ